MGHYGYGVMDGRNTQAHYSECVIACFRDAPLATDFYVASFRDGHVATDFYVASCIHFRNHPDHVLNDVLFPSTLTVIVTVVFFAPFCIVTLTATASFSSYHGRDGHLFPSTVSEVSHLCAISVASLCSYCGSYSVV